MKKLDQGLQLITLTLLSLSLSACPDQVSVVDLGAPEAGEADAEAGEERGDERGLCFADDECARAAYCAIEGDALEGQCQEGCRAEPDSCATAGSRKRCDPETRQCVLVARGPILVRGTASRGSPIIL